MGNHIYAGAEWIGSVPEHWKFYKGKFIFGESNEKGNANNLELLSPTQKYGVIPQTLYEQYTTLRTVKIKEDTDLNTFKTVHKGNFCISLRSFQGGFEYSEYEGVVSPAYHILYSRRLICDGYYKYLFKEQSFIAEMNSYCQTLRDGKNISYSDFGKTLIPYPPINEQQAIANYLDDRCSKIDAIIAEAKASIEEYKELKQSVIYEAVTKGLDKTVKLKSVNSLEVELIPIDWQWTNFQNLFHIKAGGDAKPELYSDIKDDQHPYPVYTNSKDKDATYAYTSTPMFEANTITVSGRGEIGTAFYRKEPYDAIIRLLSLSPKLKLDSRYYSYWINNVTQIVSYSTVIGQLSAQQLAPYKSAVPSFKEQNAIANYLDKYCLRIENLISEKQSLIEDLEAYKKSLIYEVVTGKRKVVA